MKIFFTLMLAASGLGFLKTILLARTLEAADFGHYISLFGSALLAGILLSFGLVEATVKRYPKLWGADPFAVLDDAHGISIKLMVRAALATAACCALVSLTPLPYAPHELAFVGMLTATSSLQNLAASVLRGCDKAQLLQNFTLARSVSSFTFALVGGSLWSWPGAIAGEVAAGVGSLLFARFVVRATAGPKVSPATPPTDMATGGMRLYFSFLMSSSTSLGDRALVGAALGAAAAGTYGVVGMVYQIGQLLVTVLAQRVGAGIIKASPSADAQDEERRKLRLQVRVLVAACAAITGSFLLLKALHFPGELFEKYDISYASILLAGAVAALQVYGLVEFHLLARHQENVILLASGVAALCFFALFLAGWSWHLPLEWFIGSAGLARLTQMVILLVFLGKRPLSS